MDPDERGSMVEARGFPNMKPLTQTVNSQNGGNPFPSGFIGVNPRFNCGISVYTTLPETVFLRLADCLRLVTALHHNFAQIHTCDAHPTRAATALGITAAIAV